VVNARADHVGSLLRPPELLRARVAHAAGELDHASSKRIEDQAIRDVIELQEGAGCQVVTDGEFRRESFQSEPTASVDGVEGVSIDAWRGAIGILRWWATSALRGPRRSL
jgi:5-methyltetrahydropteroyltriglutamate--homocysteine methyltransferase